MTELFVLLVVFQFKHFICDYLLQTEYMLGKFKRKGWIKPLSLHCGVHALVTSAVAFQWTQNILLATLLGLLDFTVHFIIDRVKASPDLLGRFKVTQKEFWWSLGLDQALHHLTHYLIIYFIVMG